MKKFLSVILLSAIIFTACGKEDTNVETTAAEAAAAETSKEETQIDEDIIPQDEMGQGMLDYVFGDYIGEDTDPVLLTGERAERLEEAFRNIRINNSRFALPMMINALPDGFTVEYDFSSETKDKENGFNFYNGELLYGGEMCANIYIIRKDGADEENGIIFGMVVMSSDCKWSFDTVEYSNDKEQLIECLGEPSCFTDMSEQLPVALYISDIGSTVMFVEEVNGFMAINSNFKNALANVLFVESVPYNDFDNMIEIPELSGEPRDIDWNMLFEDDCIIIGNDKYPAYMKIADFSTDIKLYEYNMENKYGKNSDYLCDGYLLMYKGREIGLISAIRKKDENPEDAYVFSWMFTDISSYPFPASALGIPFTQTLDAKHYYTGFEEENEAFRYRGIVENENDKFLCVMIPLSSTVLVNLTPYSVDPEAYDNFVNSQ